MRWLQRVLQAVIICAGVYACGSNEQSTTDACSAVGEPWPQAYVDMENEMLRVLNVQRSLGASCGPKSFGPLPPLITDERLACAARGHAKDMVVNNYFSHDSQNGESPFQRMSDAGYQWSNAGENIAGGFGTAESALSAFMSDEGHCTNVMGSYINIGIGYYPSDWVQDFGSPN